MMCSYSYSLREMVFCSSLPFELEDLKEVVAEVLGKHISVDGKFNEE